jgi:hypothetical protein
MVPLPDAADKFLLSFIISAHARKRIAAYLKLMHWQKTTHPHAGF